MHDRILVATHLLLDAIASSIAVPESGPDRLAPYCCCTFSAEC